MDIKTCREACKTLNVKESGIFGGYVCYKDAQERCNQNGKNGPVASLLCKRRWYVFISIRTRPFTSLF